MENNKIPGIPSIPDFYNDSSVFITGGTGFLGKLIIEKLLRCCPGIKTIFLLVRPKNDKNIVDRLNQLTNSPAFDVLREMNPSPLNKIILIQGDIACLDLGIAKHDQEMLFEKVSIVINAAASVNLNDPLKKSVFTNLRSLRELIKMARKMKNLKSFVHTSTAFCNYETPEIKENIYPLDVDHDVVINLCEKFPDFIIDKLTPYLLCGRPNTYTLAKALAENLASSEAKNMPFTIVRPSIIGASIAEPKIGWVDGYMGIAPFLDVVARGMMCTGNISTIAICDVVPADMVVNTIIAASWDIGVNEKREKNPLKIYHSAVGDTNPFSFDEFNHIACKLGRKFPSEKILWYPHTRPYYSKLPYDIDYYLTHTVPAYFIDLYMKITGRKPRAVKVSKFIKKGYDTINFASTLCYRFKLDRCNELSKSLQPEDKKFFHFDAKDINWESYYRNFFFGIRKYILKEQKLDSDLARKKLGKMRLAKYFLNGFLLTIFFLFMKKIYLQIGPSFSVPNLF